jgi:4-amino-4-deoxy-L-arabinose transferase-like glycosyltransferase
MPASNTSESAGYARAGRVCAGPALLILALAWGSVLRFEALGAREMSADEAASWASAAAPTVARVISLQTGLNPGKLPLHDLLLHAWMALFGDGLFAMRALSALCGVAAIALVYLAARELLQDSKGSRTEAALERAALTSGFAALLFALSLITIKYSREARMYPLLLVAELVQVVLFVRVQRAPKLAPWSALALFTALSLAANFSAAFLLGAEAVYLLLIFRPSRVATREAGEPRALYAALALAAGVLLLLPLAWGAFGAAIDAARTGALQWIARPALWEPLAIFNKATGTFAFPIIALAAAAGALRAGRWRRAEVRFLLAWMWAPVLIMFAFSLLIRPVFVERYVLSSFVPFFILAAVGIAAIDSARARFSAAALCLALTLGHVYAYGLRPHDAQWREATAIALSSARPAGAIAVAPAYAVNVVCYYSTAPAHSRAVSNPRLVPASIGEIAGAVANEPAVLVLGDQGVAVSERARLTVSFPHLLSRLRGVEVRLRR